MPKHPEPRSTRLQLQRIFRPLEGFLRTEAASGLVLLSVAAVAFGWANSRWSYSYFAFWHTPIRLQLPTFGLERTLAWLVNDVLMVLFFFVVGLEIRRELQHGELAEWRRAALPVFAAAGGMLVPAMLYLAFASGPITHAGWGVPMATDIAFAVGILKLLGPRVPAALRVLLLALAVIDDLGAIVVIAAVYSSGVHPSGLLIAALGFSGITALQRLAIRSKLAYIALAAAAWAGTYGAGLHPTIAGVIVGLLTRAPTPEPVPSLIERLHPWVAFGVMPMFALANAGVSITTVALRGDSAQVVIGVVAGLVLGKPLGVLGAVALCVKLGVARLPSTVGMRELLVLGSVAGVGFTMALFIAQLAFADPQLLSAAKLGVLIASGLAALVAFVIGRSTLRLEPAAG